MKQAFPNDLKEPAIDTSEPSNRDVGVSADVMDCMLVSEKLRERERFLQTMISNLPGFVYRCKNNPDWEMEYISEGIFAITGYYPEDLMVHKTITYNEIINPEYRQFLWDSWQEILSRSDGVLEAEYTITAADGTVKWVWEQGRGVYSSDGELLALEGYITDITSRKIAEQNLMTEKELLRVTLNSIGDGVITTDESGRIVSLNQVAQTMTGWSLEDAFGKPSHLVFRLIDAQDTDFVIDPVKTVMGNGTYLNGSDYLLISYSSIERAISFNASPIKETQGRILGVVLVFRDMTVEKQREQDILYLSYHDNLTGLYNRTFLDREIKRLNHEAFLPLTIIMGDVNGLKIINDIYGHRQGDKHLQSLTQIMRMACRTDDIIARWGGDEFIILLPKSTAEVADRICHKIRSLCEQMSTESIHMSIALGYASKIHPTDKMEQVLKEAEDSMYKAKLLESKSLRSTLISSMKRTLAEKSHETEAHAERLSVLTRNIGVEMELPPNQLNELELLGTLHDIGKIGINDNILTKQGPLTNEEWLEMKKHPEIGYRIALALPELAQIAEYILCHHERWDGHGYPQGIKGSAIPLPARILAVVDAFDAITHERPYRDARSVPDAKKELLKCAGTQFDPDIVAIFVNNVLP